MIWTEKRSSFFLTPWIGCPDGGVSVTGSYPAQNGLARARDPDARQIGSQTAAGALDAMTNGAVGAKDSFAVHGIAARRVGRGGSGERAQVCQDLPGFSILHARVRRHLGAGHPLLDGLEKTRVGPARGPDLRDVWSADASRVHTVAVRTAGAIKPHPAADGVGVSFKRVLCRGILGGRKAHGRRAHDCNGEHREYPSHKRLLSTEACLYNLCEGARYKNKKALQSKHLRAPIGQPVLPVQDLACILDHSGSSQG